MSAGSNDNDLTDLVGASMMSEIFCLIADRHLATAAARLVRRPSPAIDAGYRSDRQRQFDLATPWGLTSRSLYLD